MRTKKQSKTTATGKYKLCSAGTDESGKKPICAFFASEAGCRSGASCKFSHGGESGASNHNNNKNAPPAAREMGTSSESSDGESTSPFVSKKELPFVSKAASKVLHASSRTATKDDTSDDEDRDSAVKHDDNVKLENSYSSLAQPARKRKNSQVVAKPKNNKKKALNSKDAGGIKVKEEYHEGSSPPSSFSFRALNLPIATPVLHSQPSEAVESSPKAKETKDSRKPSEPAPSGLNGNKNARKQSVAPTAEEDAVKPALPLPKSACAGAVWRDLVKTTQTHRRFDGNYDFRKYMDQDESIGYASNAWVKTTPFVKSKASYPQVIAIDCEMCEAADPVTGKKDSRALCRVSVIDVATDEVLLDTLVKPSWPVTDYRDWVNGITAESLEKVQFTLRHAQAFMMELCTEETVIIGHSIHNDLAALRVEHFCCVDSALLYKAVDSKTATVALRDVAKAVLGVEMPKTHDSVNDARVAIACVEHFRKHDGDVEAVVRTPKPQMDGGEHPIHKQLFIHRIPGQNCNESHLEAMFWEHTNIRPELVDKIEYNANGQGRTHVHFTSGEHAKLAFDSFRAKAEIENSGRLQKNIYLRDGNYIRVRMMTSERKKSEN